MKASGSSIPVVGAWIAEVKAWWPKPTNRRDRIVGAVFACFGALFVGVVVRLVVGPLPLPWLEVVRSAALSAVLGLLLGLAAPKYAIVASYPILRVFGALLDGL